MSTKKIILIAISIIIAWKVIPLLINAVLFLVVYLFIN
nr:MAG TPA: protein of unknown function (DUF4519) [Microviridae sp.]